MHNAGTDDHIVEKEEAHRELMTIIISFVIKLCGWVDKYCHWRMNCLFTVNAKLTWSFFDGSRVQGRKRRFVQAPRILLLAIVVGHYWSMN